MTLPPPLAGLVRDLTGDAAAPLAAAAVFTALGLVAPAGYAEARRGRLMFAATSPGHGGTPG